MFLVRVAPEERGTPFPGTPSRNMQQHAKDATTRALDVATWGVVCGRHTGLRL
eukprot:CAMPEP_0180222246 /NCGR_PEP_ID=MMETSP0987-20121128/20566_1 /TAXON_ID=697907 /ORGANISM="non described non described, Strain CCMP2293" /LENGTH=52 /DNA_ID=CAMNT_0022184237 /DNA_START=73 /DNA_END=231 /DNA_ORIENTATION=-